MCCVCVRACVCAVVSVIVVPSGDDFNDNDIESFDPSYPCTPDSNANFSPNQYRNCLEPFIEEACAEPTAAPTPV